MFKVLVYLIILCVISGCQTTKEKPVIIIPEERVVHLDKDLLVPCQESLQSLVGTGINGSATEADFYRNASINAKLYESCKNRQAASIIQLKKFANTKEPNE